ncbi:MAG: VWA domain-containing protein [Synergistaceae bacterium]|jgi:Ca-activated chloride channel family protein|nr:VWA domain-containing protein [Synergistaceae bacterium]
MSRRINFITTIIMAALVSISANTACAAESVILEVASDSPVVETGRAQRVTVRALVRPRERSIRERAPIALALVIDKSGSMDADDKLENAKRGALEALELLGKGDIASLIAYDSEAYVLVKPSSATDISTFRRAIARLEAGGNTALYDGVEHGADAISRFVREGYVPRIILLSDGLANVGPSSSEALASLGRSLARKEMTITTIGLGLDYDEDLMTALASESGGNSYFARTSGMLADIFRRDMEDALALTGRHVKVTLTCEEGVRPIRVIGREGASESDKIEAYINNLYGDEKYAMFELDLPNLSDETNFRAGVVTVEYTDASSGRSVTLTSPLEVSYTKDSAKASKLRNSEITVQAEMAKNAEIREEVIKLADEGNAEEAASLLRSRAEYLKSGPLASAPMPMQGEVTSEIDSFNDLAAEMESTGEMSNEQRKSNTQHVYATKNQQSNAATSEDETEKD